MIDRPSLLETPNLANKSTFIESPIPGESVDDCYAWDSLIRGDYDGTDLAEWEDGKQIQETLPAAQWDAMIHDITALSYQLSQVCNSLWEEMYCIIHGAQVGMAQEAITQLLSGAQTLTNKTISFDSNTLTNVASLNTAQTLTNKTINFDDNTLQNVASLNTAQTLTNKTIDRKDNIVKCSATVISTTPYTLTPTKEMNCIIDVASGAITLGSGPYDGYELPILAKQDCTVSYVGAGGATSDNLTANQVTSYIWNGSAWIQNGVSIKPIFISTSGSVAPTSEANYVIDTASVTLTVQNGVYVGQKVWVTSNAAGSQMWYTGINGSTLIGIQNGEIARMTWNGTYWFCEIIAIITGKDAEGNAFTYGGGVSIRALPQTSPAIITTNGATLDPTESETFVCKITTTGATVSLPNGAYDGQQIMVINRTPVTTLTVTFNNDPFNYLVGPGRCVSLVYQGNVWFFQNNNSIVIHEDTYINPCNEMSITIDVAGITATIGNGKFIGQTLHLYAAIAGYFKYVGKPDGTTQVTNHAYAGYVVDLVWNGTYWHYVRKQTGVMHSFNVINTGTLTPTGYLNYVVDNYMCSVLIAGLQTSGGTGQWLTVAGPLPKGRLSVSLITASGNQLGMSQYGDSWYLDIYCANNNLIYGSFTYPIDYGWIEP